MANIYKMDEDYISAESVYDRNLGMSQTTVNSKTRIQQYVLHGTTNGYGNINIPDSVVKPSTGVVLAMTSDGNNKAVALGQTTSDIWTLRVYNYASQTMNSITNTEVYIRIFYLLF